MLSDTDNPTGTYLECEQEIESEHAHLRESYVMSDGFVSFECAEGYSMSEENYFLATNGYRERGSHNLAADYCRPEDNTWHTDAIMCYRK